MNWHAVKLQRVGELKFGEVTLQRNDVRRILSTPPNPKYIGLIKIEAPLQKSVSIYVKHRIYGSMYDEFVNWQCTWTNSRIMDCISTAGNSTILIFLNCPSSAKMLLASGDLPRWPEALSLNPTGGYAPNPRIDSCCLTSHSSPPLKNPGSASAPDWTL